MTAMEMQAEVLSTLAILVPLMAFIYTLHRGQRRQFEALEQRMDQRFAAIEQRMDQRFEALEQRMDQRFEALEQRMDQRFEAVNARIDALAYPQIKLVNR